MKHSFMILIYTCSAWQSYYIRITNALFSILFKQIIVFWMSFFYSEQSGLPFHDQILYKHFAHRMLLDLQLNF